jgi:hypothetical protein
MAASSVTGLKETIRNLKKLGTDIEQEIGKALYKEGESIMGDSKRKFVPVDTGTLKTSGRVLKPNYTVNGVSVTLGYGGAAKQYAQIVHNTTKTVNWSVAGTGAKYLEMPVRQALPSLASNIARRIKLSIK